MPLLLKCVKNIFPLKYIRASTRFISSNKGSTIINVQNCKINYVKNGTGEHHILCFPGALGSIWSDFKPQVQDLDKKKFTVVAWDPPGYGFSQPPLKKFTTKFYEEDANIAHEFMKLIGANKFSLLGWSDGGISSMMIAAKYPESVNKLVVWGSNAYLAREDVEAYERIKDLSKWSDKMKAPLVELYGKDGLQAMWLTWCDTLNDINKQGGNICKELLPLIKCPTFILHGDKDPMVAPEHPDYLLANIKNSKIYRFPQGKHNIHLRYATEFNKLVTEFLLQ